MDAIHPWINPAEFRRLAEQLLAPAPHQHGVETLDAGFGSQFVGYAPGQQEATPSPAPSQTLPRPAAPNPIGPGLASPAQSAPPGQPVPLGTTPVPPSSAPSTPVIPEPVSAIAPQAQAAPRGPFLDRVLKFRDWLHQEFNASGVFLLDRDGSVIFDESGHGKLHFLARSLAVASRRPGGAAANVHVKVGAAATLEVIPVETPYGCLVLGTVVPSPLEPPTVQAIMTAMHSVTAPPSANL